MNAKTELLEILYGKANILCAEIKTKDQTIELKKNYNHEDWMVFAYHLNFDYMNSSGDQCVFGTVWLQDGSWLTREYEVLSFSTTEYWKLNKPPDIPEYLISP